MVYFEQKYIHDRNKHLEARKLRASNLGFKDSLKITIGDIFTVNFRISGLLYSFYGICIAIKGKNFFKPDSSIILRNILTTIGIELTVSFFYIRTFFPKFDDYKRKKFFYSRSKLFFFRKKLNKYSRVI